MGPFIVLDKIKPNGQWLTRLIFLACLEGMLAFLALAIIPADPKNQLILGFSFNRLVMIGFVVAAASFSFILWRKSSRNPIQTQLWFTRLFGKKYILPHGFIWLFCLVVFILLLTAIYRVDLLLAVNHFAIIRLAPILIWFLLIGIQFWIVWIISWVTIQITLSENLINGFLAVCLFVVSFLPRAGLSSYALPYQAVWDEVVTYPAALSMLTQPGLKPASQVPGYGKTMYGDLLTYITTAGEVIGLMNGMRTQQVRSVKDFVSPPLGVPSINSAVHGSGIPLQYPRILFSFLNSFAAVGIYFISRRLMRINTWAALAGALIYAFLSREVIFYSAYILPDALSATVFVGIAAAAWIMLSDPYGKKTPLIFAGSLSGILLSLNFRNAHLLVVPFLALCLARYRQESWKKIIIVTSTMLAGFALTSPYAFLDLPLQLEKWTSFSWYQVYEWPHRLNSIAYYLQGIFLPDFNSTYVGEASGGVGLGLFTAVLAVLGLGRLFYRYTRQILFILAVFALHTFTISPIAQQFSRHALILYPLICIFAAGGLDLIIDGAAWVVRRPSGSTVSVHLCRYAGLLVFTGFAIGYSHRASSTIHYINRVRDYKVSQVQVANFLPTILKSGDKVGIVDVLPWVAADLDKREIPYERIHLTDTIDDLRLRGITHVVGTDRLASQYGSVKGTIWENSFPVDSRLAEFGSSTLEYEGYPNAYLYMFVAPLPGSIKAAQ